MDVSGALSLRMLAYSIDTAKYNVAAVQSQPVSSPQVASDVILPALQCGPGAARRASGLAAAA